jgi:hypothetical protein
VDDGTVGQGTARVDGIVSSGTALGAQHCGLKNGVAGLGTMLKGLDGVTASGWGRWWCVKGFNRGQERRHGGSGEDMTTARRLLGGHDDGTSSTGEVDDEAGSGDIFGRKFWRLDGVCESLRGLWFAKATP